jgi:hypothetical protein
VLEDWIKVDEVDVGVDEEDALLGKYAAARLPAGGIAPFKRPLDILHCMDLSCNILKTGIHLGLF